MNIGQPLRMQIVHGIRRSASRASAETGCQSSEEGNATKLQTLQDVVTTKQSCDAAGDQRTTNRRHLLTADLGALIIFFAASSSARSSCCATRRRQVDAQHKTKTQSQTHRTQTDLHRFIHQNLVPQQLFHAIFDLSKSSKLHLHLQSIQNSPKPAAACAISHL